MKSKPLKVVAVVFSVIALSGAGWQIYRWWQEEKASPDSLLYLFGRPPQNLRNLEELQKQQAAAAPSTAPASPQTRPAPRPTTRPAGPLPLADTAPLPIPRLSPEQWEKAYPLFRHVPFE